MHEIANAQLPVPDIAASGQADLRVQLLAATADLARLQILLSDACDTLLQRFHGAAHRIQGLCAVDSAAAQVADLQAELSGAVVALQFQDLAQQLIEHTRGHLQRCADDLHFTMPGAQRQAGPVTQQAMRGGSVDLY